MKRRSKKGSARKSRRSDRVLQSQFAPPQTVEEYFALTAEQQDLWRRSVHVPTRMRAENVSLPRASRESAVDPAAVLQLAGSGLRKGASGRYEAKSSDRLL